MAVLSDNDILRELGSNVVITPFNKGNLGNCSYDVTLGEHYYRDNGIDGAIYNPYDVKSVNKTWDQKKAITVERFKEFYVDGETYCVWCRHTKCICTDPPTNRRY